MFELDISHINVKEYSKEADRFISNQESYGNGFYLSAPKDSREYKEYWDLQEYYCKNGFSVGGVKITGEHYFYLNFCQIHLKDSFFTENVIKQKKAIEKRTTFPAFWDSDWYYFTESALAKEAGQHMIILKPRRRGYSFKNGAKVAWNYTFIRKSTSLILAGLKEYGEETMGMAVDYLDFLDKYTDFSHPRLVDRRSEVVQSGWTEITPDNRKVTLGYKSRIMQFSTKVTPSIARGKDANVILFEEAGSFGNLLATYKATRATVEEGLDVTGMIYAFGTGGDFSGAQVDFEEMFNNPEAYNFRTYQNIFDDGKQHTTIGYFLPDYYSKGGFITEQGLSKTTEADTYIEGHLQFLKTTAKDPNAVDAYLAEFPRKPQEGFIKTGTNILPKAEINQQINRINTEKALQFLGTNCKIYQNEKGTTICEPNDDAKPILHFPLKKDVDGEGCIIRYQLPYEESSKVPSNLYYICTDPYAIDKGEDKQLTKRDSLGASYVIKRINNVSKPYDIIVCEYVARPKFQDDYNRTLFLLADYYNAKIVFENDRDGNIISYAKTNNLLHRLEEELTVYDSNDSPKVKLGRRYGVSMSNREVKRQALQYLRDWLLSPREVDEKGNFELNIHKIYSVPLLEEMLKFDFDGNFDRISSFLVAMLYKKELLLKPSFEAGQKSIYDDEFFTRFDFNLV